MVAITADTPFIFSLNIINCLGYIKYTKNQKNTKKLLLDADEILLAYPVQYTVPVTEVPPGGVNLYTQVLATPGAVQLALVPAPSVAVKVVPGSIVVGLKTSVPVKEPVHPPAVLMVDIVPALRVVVPMFLKVKVACVPLQ
jgi:hypothetical protein